MFFKTTLIQIIAALYLCCYTHDVLSQCNGTNLALGKSATASSAESSDQGYFPPNNVTDGNGGSRWASDFYNSANPDDEWLYVDLGQSYNVCKVIIKWEDAYAKDYELIYWSGGSWVTIKSIFNNSSTYNEHNNLNVNCQVIGFKGLSRGTPYGYSMYEFEVYDGNGNPPDDPDYVPYNLKVNGSTNPTVSAGQSVTGTVTVQNQGAGYGTVHSAGQFYFSETNGLSGATKVGSIVDLQPMSPGEQHPETTTFNIPGTSSGTKYICFKADDKGEIYEGSSGGENNNVICIPIYVEPPSVNAAFTASSTNICQGEVVSFTNQSSGNPTSYSWNFSPSAVIYVNGTGPGSTNPQVQFNSPGNYTVSLTASNGSSTDVETKNNYISVSSSTAPSVTISASTNNICSGTPITFTANVTGGGSSPTYQWRVNGVLVSSNISYTASNFNNGDLVQLTIISNASCLTINTAISNTILVNVLNPITPTVTITASSYDRCPGESITFSANVIGGGSSPGYQWRVNGVLASIAASYVSSALNDGDQVQLTIISNDPCANPAAATSNVITLNCNNLVTQNITLQPGWNIISSYVWPEHSSMESIFASIQSYIALVKNGGGYIYFPSSGINTIGNWNVTEGYQVKVVGNAPQTLQISGEMVIPSSTSINLHQGWNIFAYLRDTPQPIQTALAPINAKVIIVKNGAGDIYFPSSGINNIGNMIPGEGYQAKLASDATLHYTARMASPPASMHQANLTPVHFVREFPNGGPNASLILAPKGLLKYGDEVGVFEQNGNLVGAAVYEEHTLAFPIWGDDLSTQKVEGLAEGEVFEVRVWRTNTQKEEMFELSIESGYQVYHTDGIIQASLQKTTHVNSLKGKNSLNIYPNPSKTQATLSLVLVEAAEVKVELYNLQGKLIKVVTQGRLSIGQHEINVSTAHLSNGLYHYRVFIDDIAYDLPLSVIK